MFRRGAFVFALMATVAVLVARGQPASSAREAYLTERGLRVEAEDIASYLSDELRATGYENADGIGDFFAFIMVLHGLDLDKVMRLQSGGIDIVHAMTSDARPFIEQGLFSDPAVTAEVITYRDSVDPPDGFRSTIAVRVLDRLKGAAIPDTVYLRQRGSFSEGMGPREMTPAEGERYLLLLSRPVYEFRVWRHSEVEEVRRTPPLGYYAIYRFYRADANRVIMGDGSSYDAGSVYQELRWLQELIDEL